MERSGAKCSATKLTRLVTADAERVRIEPECGGCAVETPRAVAEIDALQLERHLDHRPAEADAREEPLRVVVAVRGP